MTFEGKIDHVVGIRYSNTHLKYYVYENPPYRRRKRIVGMKNAEHKPISQS